MEYTRHRGSGVLRRLITAVFAVAFVASIISTASAFAAANLFKIQNAELSELSTTAEGSISSFDETDIVSNVTFHKLNDSAKYTITLKNTDNKDHIIESITDDNENPYVSYIYDNYANTRVNAGDSFDFIVVAKYTNGIEDPSARAQATDVKFAIQFTDIEEPEIISVSPNTGDAIIKNVIALAVSAAGLVICAIIYAKNHKKASKLVAVAIFAVIATTITTGVKAATVKINSFTLTTNYELKDIFSVIYTDKEGNEQEIIANYNEPANIPNQDKDGYTLTGWEDEQGNPVDPTQPVTDDLKIHPVYEVNSYTVRFESNNGTGSMADVEKDYDVTFTLPTNTLEREGYVFTGWDTKPNGTGVHYDNGAEVVNLTAEDGGIVTLYAQWSANPFHIDYDGNGATSGEMATTNCEYDQDCPLRDNAFVKTGYNFAGWSYNNNTYANGANLKNIIKSGTITLQAQWTPIAYTVEFDGNGTTNSSAASMAMTYDEEKNLTANGFEKTGYTFAGWKLDDTEYTDGQTVKNLTTEDGATLMLKAQWTPIRYNVAFHQNADDVSGDMPSMIVAYDESTPLTENTFALEHYKFIGWNTAEDGTGTPYEDKASIKNLTATDGATIDLYAQWKERTATLNTGANVRTALKGLADAPATFKKYDGENLPDFDALEDKVDIALADSNFPVWAWADGDNIYWWSEAEHPNFNSNSSTMFQNMKTLTTINLDGLESSTAVNMGYLFNGCTSLTDLDISEFNTANVQNMMAMFYNTPALTSINTSVLNTANVNNMSFMFRDTGATSIDISNFNTVNVKTMQSMFEKTKASSIILGNPDTLKVTNMANMFQDTLNITSLDVSGLDTDNVESMVGMFEAFNGIPKLTSLNVSNFKTSKVQNFACMFYGQANLTSLDVSNFDTSSATSMYMMFLGMTKAQSINVSGWTNDKGPAMDYMFSYTGMGVAGGTVINFENYNTKNVTNMDHMFSDMRSEAVLDLSSFDTAKVTKMGGMFSASYASTPMALKTVYVSDKFVTTALTGTQNNIFDHTRAIVGGAGTAWDASSMEKARIDDPDNNEPGYFTIKGARYIRYNGNGADNATPYGAMTSEYLKAGDKLKKNAFTRRGFKFAGWKDADGNEYTDEQVMTELVESKTPLELFAQWSEITATLNTGANVNNVLRRIAGDATSFEMYTAGTPDFSTIDGEQIISANNSPAKVYVWQDAEASKIYWWSEAYQPKFNANSASMFASLTKLTNIDLTDLNASTATNLSNLYKGDTALVSTNITAQDTSNVTNMNSMFMNTGFTELSLEGLETNNVTDMANMFNGAKNITTLDTTPLNTEKVTTMSAMFANTTALDSINLTDFDTSSVTNMSSMFSASGISSINLASFDTTNVTNISSMFKSTTNLATVDLSPLEVQSVTTMASLFEGSGITSINVAPLATESVTDMSAMFKDTLGLTELNVAPLNTTNVTTMKDMFYGSYHLASLDVSMLDTANVQSMSGTFGILGKETALKMYDTPETTKFTTSNVTDMSNMFRGDRELNQGLINIDLSHIDTSKVTNMSGMFKASRARSLDFSHFDTRKVTNMSQMFFIAPYLSTLDLSAFETPKLKNVGQMFYYDGGTGASVIDMRNFDFSKANLANLAPYGPWGGKTYYMGKFDLSSTTANTEINLGSNGTQKIYVNTEYDPSIAVERNIRVRVVANGMNGTVANNTTRTYAEHQRIDDPAHDAPGFFWIENPIVVNFDAQGGTASRTKYSYIPGTDYGTLPTITTSPEGKVFAGWYTAAEGGEKVEDGSAFISDDTHTLYAQWEAAPYTVTFDANGGEILQSTKTVTYLQSYGELPTPVRYDYENLILGSKYSFKEWNTEADGSGETITSSSIYANAGDTTLYAIWNEQFTVTIYNGESETPTIASYRIDDEVELNAQDVAGKQFLYWEVDGVKKSYGKNYSMRMFQGKDLTIRAIYGSESDLESQQPGTYISDIYRQYDDNKIVVRSYSYVPDGYEIVEAGVIATLDANIANGTFDDQTATYVRTGRNDSGTNYNNYYFTWSKSNVTSEDTVYVKAYLKYKDVDGVEHTMYGDLVTATLTE